LPLKVSERVRIHKTVVLQSDHVVAALSVNCDTLDRPVAFVGGVSIVPFIHQIRSGETAASLVELWSRQIPNEVCWKTIEWLWKNKIVVSET
jgi:hypothetical protein